MAVEGELFGPYELRELLGRGAMGEVWRAYDTRREREVALKRLSPSVAADPETQERFRREARVTARLSSLHVIPIHDFGEIDGRLFVDMRLVDGGDLARLVRAHPGGLPPARAVDLVVQIASALDAAHASDLVHRDVKPSNVLVTEHRGRDVCYLVDFGIARLGSSAPLTSTGVVIGTVAYMAPELFSGESASPRSDVYALGCLLHELLTGSAPFAGPEPVAYMVQHVNGDVPRPSSTRPALAPFDPVVARALAKDPSERPPEAGALAAAATGALARAGGAGRGAPPVERVHAGPLPQPSSRPPGRPPPGRPAGPPPPTLRAPPPQDAETDVAATDGIAPEPRRPTRRSGFLLVVLIVLAVVAGGVVVVLTTSTGPTTLTARRLPNPLAGPTWVVVSPDGRRTFVAGRDGPGRFGLVVLDTATQAVVSSVPLGVAPGDLALSPDGRRLHVTERGSDAAPGRALVTLDADSGAVLSRTDVGVGPAGVALSADGRRAYVADEGSEAVPGSTVSVVDTTTAAVTATIPVGPGPSRLAADPRGGRVYVANEGVRTAAGNTVSVIDTATDTVTATVTVGPTPRGVAVAPDARVYVANQGSGQDPRGSVSVLDAAGGVTRTLTEGVGGPVGLDVLADGSALLVADRGSDAAPGSTMTVIDTATGGVAATATVGARPVGVAATPDGRHAYVTTGTELWWVDLA